MIKAGIEVDNERLESTDLNHILSYIQRDLCHAVADRLFKDYIKELIVEPTDKGAMFSICFYLIEPNKEDLPPLAAGAFKEKIKKTYFEDEEEDLSESAFGGINLSPKKKRLR